MNRRKFLGNTALFSVPMILKGLPIFAGQGVTNPFLKNLAEVTANNGKVLVIIQLNGGNDGLNMVIPIDKYELIQPARPSVMIPKANILALDGTTNTGLHPSMTGLQSLFNNGKVKIVQGVSYPNPNFSHFRAQDILFTGSNSNESLDSGWLGRTLNVSFPNFPDGYPSATLQDPPAIQIGGSLPLALQGPEINMGYTVPSNGALQNVVNAKPGTVPASDYGAELSFLRLMKDQSNSYAGRITNSYKAVSQTLGRSTLYATSGNTLSDQLKTVASLIGGGLTTPIYIVNHPDSFDTHDNQINTGDTLTGAHANMLAKLSVAIAAFQDDLTLLGKSSLVTGMTFSEFGRRVINNTSNGTDHGTAMPVIFFGDGVEAGILGDSPVLPTNTGGITGNTQVPMQYDFRQLYTTVLQNWLGFTPSEVTTQVMNGGTFQSVGLFPAPLPLSGFNIKTSWLGNQAKIDFDVHDNDSFAQYEIMRSFSLQANKFEKVGIVLNESNSSFKRYIYTEDRVNAKDIYYKIIAISKQGKKIESKISYLSNNSFTQKISIYPNPIVNFDINIDFYEKIEDNVDINIYGTMGESLYYNQFAMKGVSKLHFKVQNMFENNVVYLMKVNYGLNKIVEKIVFA